MHDDDQAAEGERTPAAALAAAVRDRAERQRLEARLAAAEARSADLEHQLAQRAGVLDAESRDVERLESFSPARIWAALKGSREVDLDRETAERDAARYAVAEATAHRDAARREVDALAEQLRALGDAEARYRRALRDQEEWVTASGAPHGAELTRIAEERGELLSRDDELAQAQSAGVLARRHLAQAADRLGSAESWSTWDTFGGGGMLSDMMKYDRVDQATAELRRADEALAAFSRELADVRLAPVRGVEVDQLTQVFDVFFDNIFSDWGMRSRIQDAARRTAAALGAVDRALQGLEQERVEVADRLAHLEAERERLLLP